MGNVTFVQGTETDPHVPAGKVDIALMLDVYHHFNYPEKMLAAVHEALKPGGKLVVVEYYKRDLVHAEWPRAEPHPSRHAGNAIKEIEANRFHLLEEKEHVRDVQYVLIL